MTEPAQSQPGMFWAQPPPIFREKVMNGGNLIGLSQMGDVAAAGSAPIGPGRIVPGTPPVQNQVQPVGARIPNPAQAAAQIPQPAPSQHQVPVSAQRPPGAPLIGPVPQAMQARAPVANPTQPVPRTSASECNRRNYDDYKGPVAYAPEDRLAQFRNNVGGDVKTRMISFGRQFVPMNTEEKQIVIDLQTEAVRNAVLRYKSHKSPARRGDLSRVVILEVRLINLHLNVPTTVSFNLTGCKGRDYDGSTGCRGLVLASAAGGDYSEHNPTGRVIARHFPNINRASMLRYGKLCKSDLRKDITPLENKDWVLVPVNSPIMEVIEASQDGLRMKATDLHVIEDVVPVEKSLANAVVDFLEEHITNFPGSDCSQFGLTATRSSGDCFSQAGKDLEGHTTEAITYQLKSTCGFFAKFEVDYTILSETAACSEEIAQPATTAKTLTSTPVVGRGY